MKKRLEPQKLPAILLGNTRYEAPLWGKDRGLSQNGGHVLAINHSTGEELWIVALYEISYDSDMEEDKQDVFLTSLNVDASGTRLMAENERGGKFALNLLTREVSSL